MIKPIKNRILVEPIMEDEMSAGGIVVPESFRGRTSKAKIVAVGNGSKERPMRIPAGVTCWHVKGAGDEVIEDGKKFYLMMDTDVLGYLPN